MTIIPQSWRANWGPVKLVVTKTHLTSHTCYAKVVGLDWPLAAEASAWEAECVGVSGRKKPVV